MSRPLAALDLETTGLHRGCDILGYGVHSLDGHVSFTNEYNGGEGHNTLERIADEYDLVFHNASFDVRVLREHNINIVGYHDTMLMHYLLYAATGSHSLDYCADSLLGKRKLEAPTEWTEWTDDMADYCHQDTILTAELFSLLRNEMTANPRVLALYLCVERPYLERILEMESTGLYVALDKLEPLDTYLTNTTAELLYIAQQEVGLVPDKTVEYKTCTKKLVANWHNKVTHYNHCTLVDFNPSSSAHVAYALQQQGWVPTEFTATGKPKVSASEYRHWDYSIASVLAEYADATKIKGTFIDNFKAALTADSRIRTTFNQCVTLTGRLSSGGNGLNFQNIPTRGSLGKEVRGLVCAPPGHKLISVDLSNIEGRVLAHLLSTRMGDTTLSRVFSEGIDFHQANADTWGVERGEAKTLLYAVLYGAGAARVGGGDVERGERLMARLAENAPSLMALKDRAVQHCVDNDGLIYTEFGRMLYYPHVCYENALEGASKLSEDVREGKSAKQYARGLQARAKRQVFNAILQGTSADILKILSVGVSVDGLQALRLAPRITTPITGSTAIVHESGGSVAADVHDESLFYVPVESAARCASELTALFSTPLLSGCPIKGDAKIGDSWAEVH